MKNRISNKTNLVIKEYNIGHAIIGQALMIGLEKAVKEMKE